MARAKVDKPRSRSRSHSLSRAMREDDEEKRATPKEAAVEFMKSEEPEALDARQVLDTYEVAKQSGQDNLEALGTLEMVYETGSDALQRLMGHYLKEPASTRDTRYTDLCLQLLHELRQRSEPRQPDAEEVRRRIAERSATQSRTSASRHEEERATLPDIQPFPPGLGGEALFGRQDDRGALVRPSTGEGKHNPLLQGDAIVNQLFGGSDRVRRQSEDGTIKAGAVAAGGSEAEVGARMIHVLEGIKKATEGERRTSPGNQELHRNRGVARSLPGARMQHPHS